MSVLKRALLRQFMPILLLILVLMMGVMATSSEVRYDRIRHPQRLRLRRQRKRIHAPKRNKDVLEMIPSLEMYIGPEQGADAREDYRKAVLEGARVIYDAIAYAIQNKQPLLVGKMGNTEYNQVSRWFDAKRGFYNYSIDENVCRVAGVCPLTRQTIHHFAMLFVGAVREFDVQIRWHVSMYTGHKVDRVLFHKRQTIVSKLISLDPWFFTKPYSAFFENKIVLVVSSHAEFIKRQYEHNRTCIFKGREDILPEFQLKTVKTTLPPAPEESHLLYNESLYKWPAWEEKLETIRRDILNQGDFDIMLIASGSFSLPIAAEAKRNGKVAIHLGGTMNPFFGLHSSRYDSLLRYQSLIYTDCFFRMPKPPGGKFYENNAYW